MTWREDLRRVSVGGRRLIAASFRGVPFFVDTSERSGGRRAVVHEFPLRAEPFVEDLGRRARPFRIEGYVIGDGYLAQRDALLVALEDTAGPGELVHPYHGVRRAACLSFSVRETRAEGGIAMFAIEFVEAPAQAPMPSEVVDGAAQVAAGAAAALAATETELVEQYDAAGLPAFALASAETALRNLVDGMTVLLAPAIAATQELAALTSQAALITAQASSLVRQPALIVGSVLDMLSVLVETAAAAPGAVMDALIAAYATDPGPTVAATTATRTLEAANQAALVGALRRAIAIEAAVLAPLVAYASIEEATAARDEVAALLEEQAATAGDTAYPALVDLRSQVLRAVPGGTAFARVVTVARSSAVPTLLLAYQLYGSVDLEADIIARNGVRHPGFVAGELKVLSDG